MSSRLILRALFSCFLFHTVLSQSTTTTTTTTTSTLTPTTTSPSVASTTATFTSSATNAASAATSTPPDVFLNVPNLSVGRIELDVENLQADINLNANVASLVSINAGVAVSIQKVNLTIVDVEAELELIVRLGNLVDIVSRVFESLDLNPSLITSLLNNVTSILEPVVGAVAGLLGSITQGGTTLSFVIDNLGNIIQEVEGTEGSLVSSVVGNYLSNMTYTGVSQTLSSGLVEKTYSYAPLNALVNIVFNTAGQVVQAVVATSTATTTSSSTAAAQTTSS